MWDRAEARSAPRSTRRGKPYELKPGDGAFYGPKIDFDVTDSLGRAWQLGTIQLDYARPSGSTCSYVGEDNAEHRPVVIHRAVSGSFERFIAILIEHFAGAFPIWLAPEQVRVLPISDEQCAGGGRRSSSGCATRGSARSSTTRSETLKYRIRRGRADEGAVHVRGRAARGRGGQVAVHTRGAGKEQEAGAGASTSSSRG